LSKKEYFQTNENKSWASIFWKTELRPTRISKQALGRGGLDCFRKPNGKWKLTRLTSIEKSDKKKRRVPFGPDPPLLKGKEAGRHEATVETSRKKKKQNPNNT